MNQDSRIYVAGHRGMVGGAIQRCLEANGCRNLVTRTHTELDLTSQESVERFFETEEIELVYLAAAKVGGILANHTHPAEFIRENLIIQANVIHAAWRHGVRKLLFLGSSCIYPRLAPQPLKEEYLLTGPLEPTNEWYAVAKIAGIKMCQAYRRQYGFNAISVMPTNLYGPGDNFDPESSHVLPALIRKFHEAKVRGIDEVVIWGTGTPQREFLHVDDLADAAVFLMENYSGEDHINIGVGVDLSIRELAEMVARIVGCNARIVADPAKPDGVPRKLLDVTRLRALGWQARIALEDGIAATYRWFLADAELPARQVPRS